MTFKSDIKTLIENYVEASVKYRFALARYSERKSQLNLDAYQKALNNCSHHWIELNRFITKWGRGLDQIEKLLVRKAD